MKKVNSVNLQNLKEAREWALRERESVNKQLKIIDYFMLHIAPLLPEGVELGNSPYSYSNVDYFSVTIPEVEGREWRTIAQLIYRTRKALGITKLSRSVHASSDGSVSNSYYGSGTVNGKGISVNIHVGNQLPATCKVEWEEKTEMVTRKVGTVVCK